MDFAQTDTVQPEVFHIEDPAHGEVRLLETVDTHVGDLLASGTSDVYRIVIREVESAMLQKTMEHFKWNQIRAAERLGISRMTLRTKLNSFGLRKSIRVPVNGETERGHVDSRTSDIGRTATSSS